MEPVIEIDSEEGYLQWTLWPAGKSPANGYVHYGVFDTEEGLFTYKSPDDVDTWTEMWAKKLPRTWEMA